MVTRLSPLGGAANLVWKAYLRLLERHPWRAQAANTCVIMGCGDAISQLLIERRGMREYDWRRGVRFMLVGLAMAGPGMHLWYSSLDRLVKGPKLAVAVRKTLLDQCFFLPFYITCFTSSMSLLRKESLPQAAQRLASDFKPILLTSYGIWPPVMFANFYSLPGQHRVLAINLVGLVWNTYLSWKAEQ